MAFSTEHLEAVERAIARGERVVQYDGRRVEYRSAAELIQLRDLMLREQAAQAGGGGRVIRFYHGGKGV